jgi:hypothetical protein
VRQTHRVLSLAFTAGFVLNAAVIFGAGQKQPPGWLYATALVPLFLLLSTGLWLFALPYLARWRSRSRAQSASRYSQ